MEMEQAEQAWTSVSADAEAGAAPTGTRWLSDAEQHVWRAFIGACRRLFPELDGHLQHVAGVPFAYYEILVRLSEAPGRALRMTQLADASTSSKSRLSHAVARLEERGWVERLACETDRRGQVARLTDAGFAALDAAAHQHVEQVRRMVFDRLTAEQVEQLGAISAAIEAGVDDVSSSPAAAACQAERERGLVSLESLSPLDSPESAEADGGGCPLG
jgi:DNA-binding MarR family transcriptional regulator